MKKGTEIIFTKGIRKFCFWTINSVLVHITCLLSHQGLPGQAGTEGPLGRKGDQVSDRSSSSSHVARRLIAG